jgi:hypothetical protein
MPTIVRQEPTPSEDAYLQKLVEEYLKAKTFSDSAARRTDELKAELSNMVDNEGYSDHKGSKWLETKNGIQLKRERRVSVSLDQVSARAWAEGNDLWDQISVTVQMLDEDALATVAWEHPELQSEIQELYSEKENWAFKVIEPKK